MHTTSHSSNSIQWLVERTELSKRSFYSLRFIKIGARLDCGGHANEAKNFNSKDVIECNCAHNTCGINCEKCCPLYNQRPYKAATYTDTNPCEQCEVCTPFSISFLFVDFFRLFFSFIYFEFACCILSATYAFRCTHTDHTIFASLLFFFFFKLFILWLNFYRQCYGHASECYYNPEVDQRGLSINTDGIYSGGGVCLNCTVSA